MNDEPKVEDPIVSIGLLAEPNRKRLYDLVIGHREPVGRDDAAEALGMSRELAAFHLDRLAEAGLLDTERRRRGGRSGPGAGRPAKFYRRTHRDVTVSLPPRHYDVAADLMAAALGRVGTSDGAEALALVARERGADAGRDARRKAGTGARRRSVMSLFDVLRAGGFEPRVEMTSGTVGLRNCPYDALAADHRDLTCGMNLAWAQGLVDGLGLPASVELDPGHGRCCVVLHIDPAGNGRRSSAGSERLADEEGAGTRCA
jgi:predicted ArsR family transcriptional regulator